MEIDYKEISFKKIKVVKPLWKKLNEHHVQYSEFREEFKQNRFEDRINKIKDKKLKIFGAYDSEGKSEIIGYAITSISSENIGELDSLFVEKGFRGNGIGRKLMKMSLDWLRNNGVDDFFITVAVGNENALDFYNEFGFKPRSYKLKKLT